MMNIVTRLVDISAKKYPRYLISCKTPTGLWSTWFWTSWFRTCCESGESDRQSLQLIYGTCIRIYSLFRMSAWFRSKFVFWQPWLLQTLSTVLSCADPAGSKPEHQSVSEVIGATEVFTRKPLFLWVDQWRGCGCHQVTRLGRAGTEKAIGRDFLVERVPSTK